MSLRRATGRLGSAAAAAARRPAWTRKLGEAPLPAKTSRKLSVLGGSRPLAEECSLIIASCSIDLSMSSIRSIVDDSAEERELSDGWRPSPSMHVLCRGVVPSSLGDSRSESNAATIVGLAQMSEDSGAPGRAPLVRTYQICRGESRNPTCANSFGFHISHT